jgi:hypothetical protein
MNEMKRRHKIYRKHGHNLIYNLLREQIPWSFRHPPLHHYIITFSLLAPYRANTSSGVETNALLLLERENNVETQT